MEQNNTKTEADGTMLFAREAWFDKIEVGIRPLRPLRGISLASRVGVYGGHCRHGAGEPVRTLGFVPVPEIRPSPLGDPPAKQPAAEPPKGRTIRLWLNGIQGTGMPDSMITRVATGAEPSNRLGGFTDIPGIDVARTKFDVALLIGNRVLHSTFSNTEAGFEQLLIWLARHRPDQRLWAIRLRRSRRQSRRRGRAFARLHGSDRQLGFGPGSLSAQQANPGQRRQSRANLSVRTSAHQSLRR